MSVGDDYLTHATLFHTNVGDIEFPNAVIVKSNEAVRVCKVLVMTQVLNDIIELKTLVIA